MRAKERILATAALSVEVEGEINFPGVAKALRAMGYLGPVCMAAEDALDRFRQAFSLEEASCSRSERIPNG